VYPDDPIEERFVHARDLLNERLRRGESIDGDDLIDLRDDLVFLYRMARRESNIHHDRIHERIDGVDAKVDEVEKKKINRNPALVKAAWILMPVVAGFVLTIIWATTQGGTP
jgi:hypothetical protein